MAAGAVAWRPGDPRLALGVLGGGLLVGLSFWAIRGVAAGVGARDETGEIRPISRAWALVKFFTRHAILALAAYSMMARLHLDPIGLLMGVSAVFVAAAAEALSRR